MVGRFDAGGSAFDSELWCDANVLNQTYQRPLNIYQSMTVHLSSAEACRSSAMPSARTRG